MEMLIQKNQKVIYQKKDQKIKYDLCSWRRTAYPDRITDNTHYNIYGATTVAKLFFDALVKEIPTLTEYRKK